MLPIWLDEKRLKRLPGVAKVPADAPLTFGERVRRLRRERGLTHEELAQIAGVSRWILWYIENGRGKRPYWGTEQRITRALIPGIDPDVRRGGAR